MARRTKLPRWWLLLAALPVAYVIAGISLDANLRAQRGGGTASSEPGVRYVGSAACLPCHAVEHREWTGSHHAAAMQPATRETVLGRFGTEFVTRANETTRFIERDGQHLVRTVGADGTVAEARIAYVFGITPLQQYLVEQPGGRLQALGIAWDSRPADRGGQRWYELYPDSALTPRDPLHWTGREQNWNFQCAFCHSTNLRKHFDPATGAFRTTWSEVNVGCEACHGPASRHVEWASAPTPARAPHADGRGFAFRLDDRRGVTWALDPGPTARRSEPRAGANELHVCARCHSRRQQFSDDDRDLSRFFDAFRPATLDRGLYHVDGQQRDEVYEHGSFLQSRMNASGVTCSDCHNPHSGTLRYPGDGTCTQCHSASRFETAAHHRHPERSEGARCVACHMPAATYMGTDVRRDHSFRVPAPGRAAALGAPDACTACHSDRTPAWAEERIREWHPTHGQRDPGFAAAFDLADRRAPGAQAALRRVVDDPAAAAIVRASALVRLADLASPTTYEAALASLRDGDPMVRAAAVGVVATADPAIRRRHLAPLLADEARTVRMDAARALAGAAEQGLADGERRRLEAALEELRAAELFNAERPESHVNLGQLHLDRGRAGEARRAFEQALALDPAFTPAIAALGGLLRATGEADAAEGLLRRSLLGDPDNAELLHALALVLVTQRRVPEALSHLARAAERAPDVARHAYVLAVARHDTGDRAQALAGLRDALVRHPYDRDLLQALMSYEIAAGDLPSALSRAELLSALEPTRTDIVALARRLRERLGRR